MAPFNGISLTLSTPNIEPKAVLRQMTKRKPMANHGIVILVLVTSGAVKAALWLEKQPSAHGLYSMKEVLGL